MTEVGYRPHGLATSPTRHFTCNATSNIKLIDKSSRGANPTLSNQTLMYSDVFMYSSGIFSDAYESRLTSRNQRSTSEDNYQTTNLKWFHKINTDSNSKERLDITKNIEDQ